jgi:hypothetical protein
VEALAEEPEEEKGESCLFGESLDAEKCLCYDERGAGSITVET